MDFLDDHRKKLAEDGVITLNLRVRPNAKQTRVTAAMDDGSLKVDLAAPADRGKANEALVHYLSHALGIPVAGIELLSGHAHRRKIVRASRGAMRKSGTHV